MTDDPDKILVRLTDGRSMWLPANAAASMVARGDGQPEGEMDPDTQREYDAALASKTITREERSRPS